jgi:hypothetical protein
MDELQEGLDAVRVYAIGVLKHTTKYVQREVLLDVLLGELVSVHAYVS